MNYVRIEWVHQHRDEPIVLYSELDAERWEIRKVEVFRDGRCGYASHQGSSGGTKLGEVPMPNVAEIAADPQFHPLEITKDEFESVWLGREHRT